MLTRGDVRRMALELPEAHEEDHHGFPSFRVNDKIFATLPPGERVNVMIAKDAVDAAVRSAPGTVEELWWGKNLSGVSVSLPKARRAVLEPLLRAAWSRRAPKRLRDSLSQ
mgnify:CR=1 FL=1